MADVLTKVFGSARIVNAYSKIKKLQSKGLSLEDIADTFDVNYTELSGFVSICDRLVAGEKIFSIDLGQAEAVADLVEA